ncbi:MAG: pyridoxamine 5'-phosphate oxidase [Pseudomonadota bacterium]
MNDKTERALRGACAPEDPMALAEQWLQEARLARDQPNSNAMALATVNTEGLPSNRVVLCKEFDAKLGFLVFFTNYDSRKGRELPDGAPAAAVFHWDHRGRQIRLEGRVQRSPANESDAYFASRPWRSQIGAGASDQSRPIESRDALLAKVRTHANAQGAPDPTNNNSEPAQLSIQRPSNWGGIRLWVAAIELWVDGEARIHDRFRWERNLETFDSGVYSAGAWHAQRLQP